MSIARRRAYRCFGIPLAASFALPVAAAPVGFAPHRAIYQITLARAAAGSGVSDMIGRMVYELTGSSCEGYTQNMRFVTRTSNREGIETINDLRTSSWEEVGGKKLRFSSSQYQNDKLAEASQGDATRARSARGTTVKLEKPESRMVDLPADVYFPMQHATALIDAARSGQTFFSAALYDGSEKGDKHYTTTAVIGKKIDAVAGADTAALKDLAQLSEFASWPMAISYFEAGKDNEDSPPSYELAFRYYENGITENLRIDYGEFALKGELKQLELLPAIKCNATSP